jgi:cytochrome P450
MNNQVERMLRDSSVLIAAGAVSTALAITFMFYHLCQDEAQVKKLQAEIDRCWDGQSPLEAAQLGKQITSLFESARFSSFTPSKAPHDAPYLDGVINESLRLWPPAPNGMQRRAPPEGAVIDDTFVPPGTQLSVHTMGIQRDARYFSQPDSFMPERWIDDQRPTKDFNHVPRAFIPFTVGQYACLGKNLAYQELRLFMATVVKKFDFEFAQGFDPAEFERDIKYKGTLLIGPLMVKMTARH